MRTRIVPSNTKSPSFTNQFRRALRRDAAPVRTRALHTWFVRIRTDFRPDDRVWHRDVTRSCERSIQGVRWRREKDLLRNFLCRKRTMNIGPFFGWQAFGPDDVKAISIALDEVCSKLGLTDDKKQEEREVLSKRIMALGPRRTRSCGPPRQRPARACRERLARFKPFRQ
jgi:hypothetical protein